MTDRELLQMVLLWLDEAECEVEHGRYWLEAVDLNDGVISGQGLYDKIDGHIFNNP